MRMILAIPVIAAFALTACGSKDDQQIDEPISAEGAATKLADATKLTPGQYQSTGELLDFSIPGLPQNQADMMRSAAASGLASEHSFCLTKEQADEGPKAMLQQMAESNCVFGKMDVEGGSISAEMQCVSEDGMEGSFKMDGDITPTSSTMEMNIEQRVPGVPGDGTVKMKVRSVSTRVGDCT